MKTCLFILVSFLVTFSNGNTIKKISFGHTNIKGDSSIYLCDTLYLKGKLYTFVDKKNTDYDPNVIRFFFKNEDDIGVFEPKKISNYLSRGYLFLTPFEFKKFTRSFKIHRPLVYDSIPKKEHITYLGKSVIKKRREILSFEYGNNFLLFFFDIKLFKAIFWFDYDRLSNDGYIKIITPIQSDHFGID